MELNQVLKRVRQLVEKAEAQIADGATPAEREAAEIEQKLAREMADALMLKYAIEEAQIDKSRPPAARTKPEKIEVALTGDWDLVAYVAEMASSVAGHCRCQIRVYGGGYHDGAYYSKVYGFESDLRYFEILYTTLRLHMIGALSAKPVPGASIEDESYRLHNAGLNWFDIAKAFGWRQVNPEPDEPVDMYVNRDTGERKPWSKSVGLYKKAYAQAIRAKGETALRIPPGGMKTFRTSAAYGYTSRLDQRLLQVREGRLVGSDLILRSRLDDLAAFFREDNPDLFAPAITTDAKPLKMGRTRKYTPPPFSEAGYQAGVRHANSAPLNPEAGGNNQKGIS